METELDALVYWGGMIVLFLSWVYGTVSFGFDLRTRTIPDILEHRRGNRVKERRNDEEPGRETQEQRLY